jgi:hypothetical protein
MGSDAISYGCGLENNFTLHLQKTGARAVSRPFCYVKPSAISNGLSAFVFANR